MSVIMGICKGIVALVFTFVMLAIVVGIYKEYAASERGTVGVAQAAILPPPAAGEVVPVAARIPSEPADPITSKVMIAAYKDNELKADKIFKGKRWRIAGTVDKVERTFGDVDITIDRHMFERVLLTVAKSEEDAAAELHTGQRVIFEGEGNGVTAMGAPRLKNVIIVGAAQ